jgi:acyl-CoA dehydrogenase
MDEYEAMCADDAGLTKLRSAIREFLDADRRDYRWQPRVDAWLSGWDEAFSARLGAAGFLGLTIPVEYGGQGQGHLERYVVTEELLVAGAPVAAHWIADRQVAPALLSFGTEEQRVRLLPRIAAGTLFSAIGMSEDRAGSDLAAVQTRATRVNGGWLINGTKLWTSGAHHAHQIVVLARTTPVDPKHRHDGLSQFIVTTDAAEVTVNPVPLMSGAHHFNEVTFADAFVPDADVLGRIGEGWHQVTAELSFERSGPERFLSSAPLILQLIRALSTGHIEERTAAEVGDLVARLSALRLMSVSVARALVSGADASSQAALVKDLGTQFEQESIDVVSDLVDYADSDAIVAGRVHALLDEGRLHAPLFTLRGGTNEVLRGVVAKRMGLR